MNLDCNLQLQLNIIIVQKLMCPKFKFSLAAISNIQIITFVSKRHRVQW